MSTASTTWARFTMSPIGPGGSGTTTLQLPPHVTRKLLQRPRLPRPLPPPDALANARLRSLIFRAFDDGERKESGKRGESGGAARGGGGGDRDDSAFVDSTVDLTPPNDSSQGGTEGGGQRGGVEGEGRRSRVILDDARAAVSGKPYPKLADFPLVALPAPTAFYFGARNGGGGDESEHGNQQQQDTDGNHGDSGDGRSGRSSYGGLCGRMLRPRVLRTRLFKGSVSPKMDLTTQLVKWRGTRLLQESGASCEEGAGGETNGDTRSTSAMVSSTVHIHDTASTTQ